jgi:hypothetical protein
MTDDKVVDDHELDAQWRTTVLDPENTGDLPWDHQECDKRSPMPVPSGVLSTGPAASLSTVRRQDPGACRGPTAAQRQRLLGHDAQWGHHGIAPQRNHGGVWWIRQVLGDAMVAS